jgi:phage I-like protein
MQASILNRDFLRPTDGWYALEVPGEHPNRAADVVQVIDETAVASIVRRFNQEAEHYEVQNGVAYPGMLIDIEHFKHDAGRETRAYGWLVRMQNRNGVPYGQIRWTAIGQQAVDGGEYRFFSTEYDPKDLVVLNGTRPSRVRPMRLDGLTLTNEPNNRGGKPITNRSTNKLLPGEIPGVPAPRVLGDMTELISKASLDAWFKVVEKVQRTAATRSRQALTFTQSWHLAKVQFPEEYAAAFGAANGAAANGQQTSAHAVQGEVANVANRIKEATGADYRFGFNFVRENLPVFFNRMNPSSAAILNRERQASHPRALQNIAARLFNQLVRDEQTRSRHTLSVAFQQVLARERILGDLAAGRLTLEQAWAEQPELRERLMNEMA